MAIRMTGIASGLETESIVEQLMEAQKLKKTKIENKKTKLEWQQDKWKDLNTKIYNLYTGSLTKVKTAGNYNKKTTSSNNESAVTATASNSASSGSNSVEVLRLASSQYVTGGKVATGTTEDTKLSDLGLDLSGGNKEISFKNGEKTTTLEITSETKISDVISAANSVGINANFDKGQGRVFLTSSGSGLENAFTMTGVDALNTLGLSEITTADIDAYNQSGSSDAVTVGNMTVTYARDSKIKLNGAELTSSTNSLSANGVTYTLNGLTETGKAATINVNSDNDAVYNMVKDFVKEYNTLLKEMNDNYYAATAKGYDVLSDEEKEAMTDEEVEKWENKIKDSLLRRDSTLSSLTSSMRSSLMDNIEIDGKKYSLSSIGIHTSSDYTEKGLLHIYGDSDDSTYSTEENKLKKMIDENPDLVTNVLSGLSQKLYSTMNDKMKSSSLSSALTFYNDKQIKSQLDDYEDEIDKWDDRLQEMEDKYYKQFSAMETAMSKLNSQSSYLSGLFSS